MLTFLWRADAQSGFKEGIRRMQCDTSLGFSHSELTFVSTLEPALSASHQRAYRYRSGETSHKPT
jgi:hypothetical protein